jgi:hypothetical protein
VDATRRLLDVWTPRGLQEPTAELVRDVLSRAVAGCFDCCLLEETTIGFPMRMMPMWSG